MTLRQKIRQTLIDFNESRLDLEEAVESIARFVEETTTPATRGLPLEQIDTKGVHYPR